MLATSSPATNRSEWNSVDGPSYRRVKCFEVKLFVISRERWSISQYATVLAWHSQPFEMNKTDYPKNLGNSHIGNYICRCVLSWQYVPEGVGLDNCDLIY